MAVVLLLFVSAAAAAASVPGILHVNITAVLILPALTIVTATVSCMHLLVTLAGDGYCCFDRFLFFH